ncbi:hypothetical protein [Photorhabdus bodei]|uniref:Uncharacterized protein n=1 Tax=Photorhabdus bodei TaxID=2029681 RepID=A0A329WUG2_9GAMM|nr:hypothetical protein [Photorhabdus bodei]RAX06872.1 hypothetical protein CKY02_22020 [Photorhabdus bodei]
MKIIFVIILRLIAEAITYIPVIFQVASLLAALAYPGHIVRYAPGDSLPCRRRCILKSIGYTSLFYDLKFRKVHHVSVTQPHF